jgi:hypothetical protein
VVYDTPRIIKVLGEDGKQELSAINQPNAADPDHPLNDITAGKYSVTSPPARPPRPSALKPVENMMNLINAMPQTAAIIADLLVQAQDWPMADEIARRLRMMLPPGILNPKDMTPEEQQAAMSKEAAGQHPGSNPALPANWRVPENAKRNGREQRPRPQLHHPGRPWPRRGRPESRPTRPAKRRTASCRITRESAWPTDFNPRRHAMNTKAPTVAEEMAKFAGFTTNNGETVRPDDHRPPRPGRPEPER